MIYLIFTQAGFEDAQESVLANHATLWINQGVLLDKQTEILLKARITVNIFTTLVDPTNEKAIIAAIEGIEGIEGIEIEYPDTELFVEYL